MILNKRLAGFHPPAGGDEKIDAESIQGNGILGGTGKRS